MERLSVDDDMRRRVLQGIAQEQAPMPRIRAFRPLRVLVPAACVAALLVGSLAASMVLSDPPGTIIDEPSLVVDDVEQPKSDGKQVSKGESDSHEEKSSAASSASAEQPSQDESVDAQAPGGDSPEGGDGAGDSASSEGDSAVAEPPSGEGPASDDGQPPAKPPAEDSESSAPGKTSLEDAVITGVSDQTYTGASLACSPSISFEGKALEQGADYTLSYQNADGTVIGSGEIVHAGTYYVVVEGKGDYEGSVRRQFAILPATVSDASIEDLQYSGSALEPVVFKGKIALVRDVDYVLQITDSNGAVVDVSSLKDVGDYVAQVSGMGDYGGNATIAFKVVGKTAEIDGEMVSSEDGEEPDSNTTVTGEEQTE